MHKTLINLNKLTTLSLFLAFCATSCISKQETQQNYAENDETQRYEQEQEVKTSEASKQDIEKISQLLKENKTETSQINDVMLYFEQKENCDKMFYLFNKNHTEQRTATVKTSNGKEDKINTFTLKPRSSIQLGCKTNSDGSVNSYKILN